MPDPAVVLTKFVAVRRSPVVPALHWWTLPLPVQRLAGLYADLIAGAGALVSPGQAVGAGAQVAARLLPGDVALVADGAALLTARDQGRVAPCTIAFFPPGMSDADLETHAAAMRDALETLPFTIALQPEGDGRARHHYCFRVPGKVVLALEHLALERGFGSHPEQVEKALVQGLQLRPGQRLELQLVLRDGKASLGGASSTGRQSVKYLESGKGYTGSSAALPFGTALRDHTREAWRRFPVGVVMLAGLPVFIAAFWIGRWAGRPGARATAAVTPPGSVASP